MRDAHEIARPGVTGVSGFRPDIEGLRALSIIAVVLYHARAPGFSGGFVGVDVFFVISGFLITGLLLRELERGRRIDLWAFWARRARRLLPNAYLTLLAILAATAIFVSPDRRSGIVNDVLAALFYVANYRFADRTVDYFDPDAQLSPVLHFWSLGVEEQFYIVWPLLLLAIFAFRPSGFMKRAAVALAVTGAVSFALSLFLMTKNQPQAFFHTEARIWQLAAGGVLAASAARLSLISPVWRSALAWLGLGGIVASIALFDASFPYPGYWALVPTVCAAALIAGANAMSAAPGFLLSLAPMRWIGARSYSLYLWHWPLLVFVPLIFPGAPQPEWIALALLMPIAAAAYTFVEDPIRRGVMLSAGSKLTLVRAAAGCAVVVAASLGLAAFAPGQAPREAEAMRRMEQAMADRPRVYDDDCDLDFGELIQPPCIYGAKGSSRVVVLFGDSHAAHLFEGLNEAALLSGWELRSWTKSSCPPIEAPVWKKEIRGPDPSCAQWRESMIQRLIAERPQAVFISTWTGLAHRMNDPNTGKKLGENESLDVWRQGFSSVLRRLSQAGLRVIVVRDTPKSRRDDMIECLSRPDERDCATPRLEAIDSDMPDVESARAVPSIEVLDLTDSICGTNVCPALKNGMPLYRDRTHFTASFSKTLAPRFQEFLARADAARASK